MEERQRASGVERTRPPSAHPSRSFLQRLQSENDSLRSALLRSQQKSASLQQQFDSLRNSTDQIVKNAVAVNTEQMRALEERCRLLADRLVTAKRDEQVSESARVGFLLRSQLEERRFLKRGLTAMLELLAGTAVTASSEMLADTVDHPEKEEVHTGTLYRLIMAASNALLEHTASVKLEKARARLILEHATSVIGEVQRALTDATRATFEAMAHANAFEEKLTVAVSGTDGLPALTMLSRGTAFSCIRNGFNTPSPYRRPSAGGSAHAFDGDASHTTSTSSAALHSSLSEELEWICDVMKACVRGLREVDGDIGAANAALRALPSASFTSSREVRGENPLLLNKAKAFPLADTASPEMNDLLRSFLVDLDTIKRSAAEQQEELARQLAHEVNRHYDSTRQYEERIKLLEAECARLLRYAERVAKEQVKRSSANLAAAAAAPTIPPATSQQSVPRPERHVDAGAAALTAERPATSTAKREDESEDDESNRVTPERYVPKSTGAKSAVSRFPCEHFSSVLQSYQTGEETPLQGNSRRARSARGKRQKRGGVTTAAVHTSSQLEVNRSLGNYLEQPVSKAPKPQQQSWSTHSLLKEVSPNYRLNFSAAKSPLLSPRRGTPPEAAPGTPSPSAAALWSHYHSLNTSLQGDISSIAGRSSPQRYQRLMSPAPLPPLPPPPAPQLLSSRPSTSLWRRSATASLPPGWTGTAALQPTMSPTSISSVSSTSDRFSTPHQTARNADGFVSSQIHSRVPPLRSSPFAMGKVTTAAPAEGTKVYMAGNSKQPPAASPSTSPSPPEPRVVSAVSSSPSAHSANHTRLLQQLYDEAAADVFSDSTSFTDGASTPTSAQHLRRSHLHLRSQLYSKGDGDGSPRVRPPSPRRPIHLGFYVPSTHAGAAAATVPNDSARPSHDRLSFAPPPSPRSLPSPPRGSGFSMRTATATTPAGTGGKEEATPPIWRQIREEASFRPPQQMPSPITGASDLFGTPREVSWLDS